MVFIVKRLALCIYQPQPVLGQNAALGCIALIPAAAADGVQKQPHGVCAGTGNQRRCQDSSKRAVTGTSYLDIAYISYRYTVSSMTCQAFQAAGAQVGFAVTAVGATVLFLRQCTNQGDATCHPFNYPLDSPQGTSNLLGQTPMAPNWLGCLKMVAQPANLADMHCAGPEHTCTTQHMLQTSFKHNL